MTLYGYSREPDPAAQDEADVVVPQARIASDPVRVPTDDEPDGLDTLSGEATSLVGGVRGVCLLYTSDAADE